MTQEQEKVPGFRERLGQVITEKFDGEDRKLAIALGRATQEQGEEAPRSVIAGTSRKAQEEHERQDAAVWARQYWPSVLRWRAGGLPDAKSLLLLRKATGDAVDWWLLGPQEKRYPWMPDAWTPDVSRTFAVDFFRASAAQLLDERAEKLETLRRLADVAGDDGLADYGIEGDIRGKVSALALVWLGEVHNKVRDLVDGEINARIAMHLSKGRRPGPVRRKGAGPARKARRTRGR